MDIAVYTLRAVAYTITDPSFVFLLLVIGFILYSKNRKTALMQKMIIGSSLHTPFELTISQIVLGILGGALGSLMMSYLGIAFNKNSAIVVLFVISVVLMLLRPRFLCFSYSGAILGILSLLNTLFGKYLGIGSIGIFEVNIISLISLVGVLHIIEGILVMVDGDKGAIPIFANRGKSIVGGFALRRFWPLPIAFFIILNSTTRTLGSDSVVMPNWWPILNGTFDSEMFSNAVLQFMPIFAILGYNSMTFTRSKRQKAMFSGVLTLAYGVTIVAATQVAYINDFMKLLLVIFTPLLHEVMIRFEKSLEVKNKPKYFSSDEGVMVLEVAPMSPAKEMGIESGDILIEINNTKIDGEENLLKAIKELQENVLLKVKKKSGELREVTYNKMKKQKRLGMVFVPKYVPKDTKLVECNVEKFSDVLDKIIHKKDEDK